MTARAMLLAALLIGAVGCQADRLAATAPDADTTAVTVANPPAPTVAYRLALDPDGLRLVDPRSGSMRALTFSTPDTTVLNTLARVRPETPERGTNPECGAGPLDYAQWADGLTLWLASGQFVGWSVDGRRPGADRLTTPAGLGPGLTRASAEQVVTLDVEESTLGTEFTSGTLSGLFSGDGPNDTVTALWAGTSCVFR